MKVPDMSQGMWPSMWFLPRRSGAPFNEIDFVQGGLTEGGGPVNQSPLGTAYFPSGQSNPVGDPIPDLGFDVRLRYHVYGVQWTPGPSASKDSSTASSIWTVTQAQVPGGIVAEPYEIILDLPVAVRLRPTLTTPSRQPLRPAAAMKVAEVQAYSRSVAALPVLLRN